MPPLHVGPIKDCTLWSLINSDGPNSALTAFPKFLLLVPEAQIGQIHLDGHQQRVGLTWLSEYVEADKHR